VGTKIEGNFQSAENIRLDGEIIGDLSCEKKLVLGPSGRIKGNVTAREAVVMGVIAGDLDIKGSLHLDRSASVKGNVTAALLSIEEGASYQGTCEVKK
jgi:cytoskeletal protein CcmA (bactofilin family)